MAREFTAQSTPVRDGVDDDHLACDALYCLDMDPESVELQSDQAWQCKIYVTGHDIQQWRGEDNPLECVFIAAAGKRQRAEVKLTNLTAEEKVELQKAKNPRNPKLVTYRCHIPHSKRSSPPRPNP
jgi:hypothetical protein